jgi:diaminopimelate epimerase
MAAAICDRRLGVGADGVLVIGTDDLPEGVLASMTVWNADGSIPEMCGNGLRCVVVRLVEDGHMDGPTARVLTGAGVLTVRRIGEEVAVDMGPPAIGGTRTVRGMTGTDVSMGNPHFIVFSDEHGNADDLTVWGPGLETDPAFPDRTNVEWAVIEAPDRIRLRVWERGVGETQACGTGACATAVAAIHTGRTSADTVLVHLPGGRLAVHWPGGASSVTMTGPARTVFPGEWPLRRAGRPTMEEP